MVRLFPQDPPGLQPFRADGFPSPVRSPRVTTWLGIALASAVGICFSTGLFSHLQQHPVSWFPIAPAPVWLYRLTQGLHVASGLAAIPLVLLKLWSVSPRLFVWPPVRSLLHALERLSVFVLVAALLFQLATGTVNNTQWYPWSFPFVQTHYAMAYVIVGALLVHLGAKGPVILAALRSRSGRRTPRSGDEVEAAPVPAGSAPGGTDASGGLTRRGLLVTGGLAVGAVTVTTVGQTVAPLKGLALLAPRVPDVGPQSVPVNRTAVAAGIEAADVGPDYRLVVACPGGTRALSRAEILRLPQTGVSLPIACVEGWSASATWTGVSVGELMDLVGGDPDAPVRVVSLERSGSYAVSELPPQFARDPATILALTLNGQTLDLDHGYPARIMAPNRPGVLQTKWVTRLESA